jgi:hypothetical protein
MQEGVLRGAGSDPSFLFQLLTLQKGLRLSDWDIAFRRGHWDIPLSLYLRAQETLKREDPYRYTVSTRINFSHPM